MSKKDEKVENEQLQNIENQLKRALADYQNLEKRIAEEKSSWIKTANKNLLLRLLPGLDSLLLAEKHTKDEGIRLSIEHFIEALKQEGVNKIEAVGKDFDPHFMDAVSTKAGENGKVVEEIKAGYTLNGEVIRPSQVIVGSENAEKQKETN